MENNNYNLYFDIANESDIPGIMTIEKSFFATGVAYTEKDIRKWMKHNPNMFYVIRDNIGQVKAFTIMAPITEECYNKFKNGLVTDMNQFELSDIEITLQSDYYYFADVASLEKDTIASMLLFKNILPIMWEHTHYIVTTPITEEGKNKSRRLGAKNINGEDYLELNKPCYIEVATCKNIAQKYIGTIEKILSRRKK